MSIQEIRMLIVGDITIWISGFLAGGLFVHARLRNKESKGDMLYWQGYDDAEKYFREGGSFK